jgi:hypothetical protein
VTNKPRLPILLPPRSPIAHWTRPCSNAPLALFAGCRPFHERFSYHIPTTKLTRAPAKHLGFAGLCHAFAMSPKETDCFAFLCEAFLKVNDPSALSVLDPATGNFLEHRQVRRDPPLQNHMGYFLCQRVRLTLPRHWIWLRSNWSMGSGYQYLLHH